MYIWLYMGGIWTRQDECEIAQAILTQLFKCPIRNLKPLGRSPVFDAAHSSGATFAGSFRTTIRIEVDL